MKIIEITSPRSRLGSIAHLLGSSKKNAAVEAQPDVCYVLPSVILDAEHLNKYREVCGFKASQGVPLIYPQMLTFGLVMEFLGSEYCPWPAMGMVHLANRIEQYKPLYVGDDLRVELRAGDLLRHEKGQVFNLELQILRGDERIWQATQSTLYRAIKQPVGESYNSVLDTDIPLSRQASFSVPANIGRRYAKISGDVNPIHLSALSAKALGFKRAIAHGMWTKARALSALLPDEQVAQATAVVEFKLPLYLPGNASLWSRRSEQSAHFELRDRQGEKPHLRGQLNYT